ncbi:MAG: hypothetical protein IPK00_03700 [Deltaproteobacteria bacterium]|nr:hypothetical protein [Deltaproteobacteria bacterium]
MSEESALDDAIAFLPGFAWAVPDAFAPAVSAYRFEQGDVLHRNRRGYDPLSGRIPKGLTALQLRHPPRSARTLPSEYEGDRRLANWQSEVELELVDPAAGNVEVFSSTQGRLFMALWKGHEDGLRGEGDDPPLPRSARELAQSLRDGELDRPGPTRPGPGCRFRFVVDLSSDASRGKSAAIADALAALGRFEARDLDPIAAGARDGGLFHPTLVVRELVLENVAVEAAEAALKRALYVGSGETERFSVSRHGVLEALAPVIAE